METAQRIAQLEALRSRQRAEVALAAAALRGTEAELESLRAGLSKVSDLNELPRTDAILAVLRTTPGTLTPSEITTRLSAEGRNDSREAVTATLDYLLKQGLVLRPSRGRYLAA